VRHRKEEGKRGKRGMGGRFTIVVFPERRKRDLRNYEEVSSSSPQGELGGGKKKEGQLRLGFPLPMIALLSCPEKRKPAPTYNLGLVLTLPLPLPPSLPREPPFLRTEPRSPAGGRRKEKKPPARTPVCKKKKSRQPARAGFDLREGEKRRKGTPTAFTLPVPGGEKKKKAKPFPPLRAWAATETKKKEKSRSETRKGSASRVQRPYSRAWSAVFPCHGRGEKGKKNVLVALGPRRSKGGRKKKKKDVD